VTQFERSPNPSSERGTEAFVRELLARTPKESPTRSSATSNGTAYVGAVLHPEVIDVPNHSGSMSTQVVVSDHTSMPMPPLTIGEMEQRAKRPIPHPVPNDPRDPEIYRLIYAGLKLPLQAPVVVVGITSAIRGEGRSTIARLMAKNLSLELDVRVTLVDADIEHPTLLVNSQHAPPLGISSVLRGECNVHEVSSVWSAQYPNLYVIPAGEAGEDAPWVLRRLGTHDPFRGSGGLRGLVILDLPPLVDGSFGAVAARVADATVLVVRAGVTHTGSVREAVARMADRPPQGVVLNAFRTATPGWAHGLR
jgi:Mrp family chromosome partitioning ATPase